MMVATLVLFALGGVAAGCLYTPDANGHATVPDGVTSIGDAAFKDCFTLVSIVLPSSVTSIGDEAFRACVRLVSMKLSDGLVSIGDQAFAYCSSLDSIALPNLALS